MALPALRRCTIDLDTSGYSAVDDYRITMGDPFGTICSWDAPLLEAIRFHDIGPPHGDEQFDLVTVPPIFADPQAIFPALSKLDLDCMHLSDEGYAIVGARLPHLTDVKLKGAYRGNASDATDRTISIMLQVAEATRPNEPWNTVSCTFCTQGCRAYSLPWREYHASTMAMWRHMVRLALLMPRLEELSFHGNVWARNQEGDVAALFAGVDPERCWPQLRRLTLGAMTAGGMAELNDSSFREWDLDVLNVGMIDSATGMEPLAPALSKCSAYTISLNDGNPAPEAGPLLPP